MGKKRRPAIGITSQADADEQAARELAWKAKWAGLSSRGVEDRAKQLMQMPPQPRELEPPSTDLAPARKANGRRDRLP
jgi:hypothetical protein